MGRSGSAGHLDRPVPDAAAAARRSSPTRNSSPTRSARRSTSSAPGSCVATSAWSAAASATSPAPTTPCSSRCRPTGKRTSLIVDPPDGRIPALTRGGDEAKRSWSASTRLALLQPTETCKNKDAACAGGKYGPVSPRRNEMPPLYNTGRTQSERRSRGSQHDRALHGRRAARLRRLSAHRAVAGSGVDLLRHRAGAGVAARDPGRRRARICRRRSASASATRAAAGRATRWSSTSPTSRRSSASRPRARTCISSSASRVSTPTRSSTRSRSRIRRRGRGRGR